MKKVIMPATFSREGGLTNMERDENTLDLDALFWEVFFSKAKVRELFNEYIRMSNLTDEFISYLDFIIANLDATEMIRKEVLTLPFEEKRALYCFKVYFFITSIFNKMNRDYTISLPYGVFFNHSFDKVENFINEKNFISDFFDEVLDKNSFFENNSEYLFKIYWENEAFTILLLAYKMRKKFDNIKITVDLSNVNELTDFSSWQTSALFNRYVDGFKGVFYKEEGQNQLRDDSKLKFFYYGKDKRLVTRLFDTTCYWNKCSFCVINSRFTSKKKVDKLNLQATKDVDSIISIIKNTEDLSSLVFTDEAIEFSILIYFAEQLLKHHIKITWSVRVRVSDKFTIDNCRILAKSGLKYIGFGLESVNSRILKLMNKHEREYSKEELSNIFKNCDKAGINAHAYFIIGFPSETIQETDETLAFADYQLRNRRYFTYTINVFYLMKGSGVYKNPKKYGIQISDQYENSKLADINFIDNNPGEKYTRKELEYLSRSAYAKLFFNDSILDYVTIQTGDNFWYFLERTGLFYEHKLVNNCNPYLYEPIIDSLDEVLDYCFRLLPIFITYENREYYNILNEKKVSIKTEIKDIFTFFVDNFNSKITLRENINDCLNYFNLNINAMENIDNQRRIKIFEKYIIKLIKDSHLYRPGVKIGEV